MSSRASASISIILHGLAIWALSMIAISPVPEKIVVPGMEFELVDVEHAMPLPAPVVPSDAEASDIPTPAPVAEPTEVVTPKATTPPPAPMEKPVPQPVQAKQAVPVPKPQLAPAPVSPKIVPVPDAVPIQPKAASASPAKAAAKAAPVVNTPAKPRLDTGALSKIMTGKVAAARVPRMNSGAIGSAIGKAAPKGAASLTLRQRANLEDMIRSQITPCWNPPSVDDRAGQLSVVMRIRLEKSGALSGAPVVVAVKGQTETNAAYAKSLAGSVRRAVISCAPLRLPSELYDAWADVELVFDPRDIL